jgi:hypothetical protein
MGVKLGLHCLTNIEVSEEGVMRGMYGLKIEKITTEWSCSPSMIRGDTIKG